MRRLTLKLSLLSLLSVMSVTTWALAQGGVKDDKTATMDLMRTVVPKAAYEAMLEQTYAQMSAAMQQMGGRDIPADKQKAIREAVQECLPYDELLGWSAEVYLKHFTRKEIDDLAAFYKTPTGKKVATLLPVLSGEVGAKMGPILMSRMPAALKKHGLE